MSRPRTPKSLHDNLVAACDAVGVVPKRGKNTTDDYNYQRASDVALAFRHELFKRGIRVAPNEVECKHETIQTNGGTPLTEVWLTLDFIVTDGKEEIKYRAFGTARDNKDKALWKAKTGAQKYFLRGLGLIPDTEDDPEFEEITHDAPVAGETKPAKPTRGNAQHAIREYEVKGFLEACDRGHKSQTETEAYLAREYGISTIAQLQRKDFKAAYLWAIDPLSGGRAEDADHDRRAIPDPQPTAMTPPDINAEAAVSALGQSAAPQIEEQRKPQLVVREMDAQPEFKLRGY